jgi:hypothetical protein
MPLVIENLHCRVVVRGKTKRESPLGAAEESPRPNLLYAMPNAPVSQETAPLPSRTAEGQREQAEEQDRAPVARPRRADPKAVTDRVYELLKEDIRQQRLRGG